MLWVIIALISAVCTSLTTIFAKVGIRNVNSNFATAYRTLIVIFCSFFICLLRNNLGLFNTLTLSNYVFLILSGIATGLSWLCYYKALKIGDVNKVAPIDKSSFILSSILFLIFFFDDTTNHGNGLTIIMLIISIILIGIGTILMINPSNNTTNNTNKSWLIYAVLSAIFAAVVSLFVKIGLKNINSNLGTLIRTIIVFIFAVSIVLVKKDYKDVKLIDTKSWIFLTLSGIATGLSWLLEYYALNIPSANPVVVNSIGKLAIVFTILFSYLFLKEKFTKKTILGLLILVSGIVLVIIFC